MSTMVKVADRVLSRDQRQVLDYVCGKLDGNPMRSLLSWWTWVRMPESLHSDLVVLESLGILRSMRIAYCRGWAKLTRRPDLMQAILSAKLIEDPNYDPRSESWGD